MSAQGWAHGTATATVGTQSCQNALTCRDQDGVKGEDTDRTGRAVGWQVL